MTYLEFSSIDEDSFKVRIGGLDTTYNQTTRKAIFDLYKGKKLIDWETIYLSNGSSTSSYVKFSGLLPDTRYDVEVEISNIQGSSNKYLDDYVWTDEIDLDDPDPELYDRGMDFLEIEWDAVPYAYSYNWSLYEGGNLSTGTLYAYGDTMGTDEYFSGLSPDTVYTFYVRAEVGSQQSGPGILSTRTLGIPAPDVGIYSVSEDSIVIMIYKVTGATSYRVYIDGSLDGTQSAFSGTYAFYIISGLTMGRNYSIRVAARVGTTTGPQSYVVTGTTLYPYPFTTTGAVTGTTANISWTSVSGATRYYIYLDGVNKGYVTGTSYQFTGLIPLKEYGYYVQAYNGYVYSNSGLILTLFTTTSGRPLNWNWEYSIVSGGGFYAQSGSTVFLMRAAHWNAFTARINEFRDYKSKTQYTFTTATTSTTEIGIRNCINQAITAINAMGFSQPSISSGDNVAASVFLTMRNNLNSIT